MFFWISLSLTFFVAYIAGNHSSVYKSLNYLLLMLLIVDIFFIGHYLIINVPRFISFVIKYLQNMTSSLDAVVLVALITGIISLLNSFYSRYSDNRNKRREYLAAKREEPYSEFISLVYKMTQNEESGFICNKEMLDEIRSFNSRLPLWGSSQVVKKWNSFRENSLDENMKDSPEKTLILMEEVMNAMRKDLGVKSVGRGNLLSFFINDIEKIIGKQK